MTTHEIRKWFGWTQKEMSLYWNIPIATIKNWDTRSCMPGYVYKMAKEIRECWDDLRAAK